MAAPTRNETPFRNLQNVRQERARDSYMRVVIADDVPDDSSMEDVEKNAADSLAPSIYSERKTSFEFFPDEHHPKDNYIINNIVDWDGPNDPANPMNWTPAKKWTIVAVLSTATFITPLASSFFAPGVPQVLRSFHETSTLIAAWVVSVYVLGFAIGPIVVAPMSELYGRMIVYNICGALFTGFNIACAESTSMNMLICFRFLAGCAGSAPVTLGGGTIGDMFPPEKRAGAMAIWALGPLLGPVVGPICGGFLVQSMAWRWVFWLLAIFGGAFAILFLLIGRETYAPVLLERKTARLRKETGNTALKAKLANELPAKEVFTRAIVRPLKMLFLSPIVNLTSLYMALNYGILYLFFTTFTYVFGKTYRFSSGMIGLSYIGLGVGMMVGMAITGVYSDRNIRNKQAKGGIPTPEDRLPAVLTIPGSLGLPIGCFIYGWTTYYKVHWIVPIASTSLVGLSLVIVFMTILTYLVDAFTIHAASAVAANTILRSLFGAVLPLAGLDMYNALGLGWGNSLLGFIGLAFIPVPILFQVYGERIRTNPRFQPKF